MLTGVLWLMWREEQTGLEEPGSRGSQEKELYRSRTEIMKAGPARD